MSPAIVIPSYWAEGDKPGGLGERDVYDYTTPIDKPLPELELCLSSLEQVRGVIRVIVLVVAPPTCAEAARARVNSICRAHSSLNPLVIGAPEAAHIERAVGRVAHHVVGETVSLRGYGAIKNMGLAVASVFGHDAVVFLDDDEIALDENFLIDAVWALGSTSRQNLRVYAKSGYYTNVDDSPFATATDAWTEKYWSKAADFNELMAKALDSPVRLTRANHLCGGCCALHAAAFTKVPFDPYITRGEDLDYVLDLRANGMDVWFDNVWHVRSQPPAEMAPRPALFMQNVYRWLYERRKLEALNARRDLRRVTTESLEPYPAPWVSSEVGSRITRTALRRLVKGPDRLAYLHILAKGCREADRFALASSTRYLSFAMMWPTIASTLWDDHYLQGVILSTGRTSPATHGVALPSIAPSSNTTADATLASTGPLVAEGGAR